MENNSTKVICAACGREEAVFAFAKNNCSLYRCILCRYEMIFPIPEASKLDKIYSEDYFKGRRAGFGYVNYDSDKEAMREIFKRHLKGLEERIGKKGRLLDVGAATGFFVSIAMECGWEASGVEISPYAAEVGRKRGLNISSGTLETLGESPESFDVITMWDVIEHMPNPKANLRKAYGLLRPGGLLALNTPDSGSLIARLLGKRWHLYVPPEHLHYFNQNSMRILLESLQFNVLSFSKVGKRFTLLYVIETLYTWQKLSLWKKCAEILRRHPRLAALSLSIHLRDNMYVLAERATKK